LGKGTSTEKLGASPGAFVTVKVDHRAVSHAYEVVGVILKVTDVSAVKIITKGSILCNGTLRTIW
jgi:hypothetical protein